MCVMFIGVCLFVMLIGVCLCVIFIGVRLCILFICVCLCAMFIGVLMFIGGCLEWGGGWIKFLLLFCLNQ